MNEKPKPGSAALRLVATMPPHQCWASGLSRPCGRGTCRAVEETASRNLLFLSRSTSRRSPRRPLKRGKHASAVGRRLAAGSRAPKCARSAHCRSLSADCKKLVRQAKQDPALGCLSCQMLGALPLAGRTVLDRSCPVRPGGRGRAACCSRWAQATAEPSRTKPQGWATATRGR
jgi:hypothetical protein